MKLYAGKEAEEIFFRIVSGSTTTDETFQASKSNEKAGGEMAKHCLDYILSDREGVVDQLRSHEKLTRSSDCYSYIDLQ
jgi:hypothetical protein